MSFSIEDELKKLPELPGVYIMRDFSDEVIYVGKAVSLKKRVKQYFRRDSGKSVKILKMVPRICRFEYIVTDSELEALILECNLIKEYRPKYNTLLKDDKTYPYISVTLGEKFPRVIKARKIKKDKSRYFGPYSDAGAVNETINLIRKLYKIRPCNYNTENPGTRSCLYYQMNMCSAPCEGRISREEYLMGVEKAISFLNGNFGSLLNELSVKMNDASLNMRFEEASRIRDLIKCVRHIGEKQKAAFGAGKESDIVAVALSESEAVAQIFFVRAGKLIGREHYHLKINPCDTEAEVISEFVKQFYSGALFVPGEIILPEVLDETAIIREWLSSKSKKKVNIVVPKKGNRRKLVLLAKKNARLILEQDLERLRKEDDYVKDTVSRLGKILNIKFPARIEAYDISNIGGYLNVGSMVVYKNGLPRRADYRKFRIKSVEGPDDYACMREVLTRRFERALANDPGFDELPDLILMDGGKGQVNAAKDVLKTLNLDIPVAGMVKDKSHKTRGLYYSNSEKKLSDDCFLFINRVQDEVHRFAIDYHRLLRRRGQIHSLLDDIPLIGEARKKSLMSSFENIEQIKEASLDDLEKVPAMNKASAQSVYDYFHNKDTTR